VAELQTKHSKSKNARVAQAKSAHAADIVVDRAFSAFQTSRAKLMQELQNPTQASEATSECREHRDSELQALAARLEADLAALRALRSAV